MRVLVFDTESTGLIRTTSYSDVNNPYLASLAVLLYDTEANRIVSSLNTTIYPAGWVMPPEAEAVNGLSTQYLQDTGVPSQAVIPLFMPIASKADLVVGHNVEFDIKIMSAALWRHIVADQNENFAHEIITKHWLTKPTFCTMKESKNEVQALNKSGRLKYPKLTEAYKHFFGKDLNRAHSANADAVATLEIYLALTQEDVKL